MLLKWSCARGRLGSLRGEGMEGITTTTISLLQLFFEPYLDQSFQPTFDKFEAYFFKFWFAGIFDNLRFDLRGF